VGRVAHAMAAESSHIVADVIEVQEYPQLVQAYAFRGVPKTVINEHLTFTGAVPEGTFVQRVLEAVDSSEVGQASEELGSEQSTLIA